MRTIFPNIINKIYTFFYKLMLRQNLDEQFKNLGKWFVALPGHTNTPNANTPNFKFHQKSSSGSRDTCNFASYFCSYDILNSPINYIWSLIMM